MELFKAELQRFIRHQGKREDLEQVISDTLISTPECLDQITAGLSRLAEAGHLEQNVADELILLARSTTENESGDDDKTQFAAEDQTRLTSTDETVVSLENQDQTVVANTQASDHADSTRFGGTVTQTGLTTPTSRTSNTSTTSKWAKPFVEDAVESSLLTVGSIVKDRFRLIEFIGCGGMGDVYKAEDQRRVDAQDIDTLLAIKVLNNNFKDHPESLRSLQREARKTQNLAHPNIVNVFDFDRDQHHVFMTMELMRGEPLNKVIKINPRGLPLETVFRYVAEMGAALNYAHANGIIHSDFKPSNIFLDQNTIKVFDFGIARAAKEGQVDNFDAGELGALTPTYASPEMLAGHQQADPKDDIYALACITYELITGKHPFLEKNKKVPADVARNKGMTPQTIKNLNRKQWKALKQGLSFDSATRTPSVEHFLADFLPENHNNNLLTKWYIWPIAASVLSALAYLPAKDYWEKKQLDDLIDGLKTGSDDEILGLISQIEEMPETEQIRYFNDTRVKSSLTKFFVEQMNGEVSEDDYIEAERLAKRALSIYEDSRRLTDQRELVVKRKASRLNELNIELNRFVNAALGLFIEQIDQIPALFSAIRKVDGQNPMLNDPRLPDRMIEAIDSLSKVNDFAKAKHINAIALSLFPDNVSVKVTTKKLSQQQYKFEQKERIAAYETSLAGAANNLSYADLDDYTQAVTDLNQLVPDSRELVAFKDKVSPIIRTEFEKYFTANEWYSAENEYQRSQVFLSNDVSAELKTKIEEGKESYQKALHSKTSSILESISIGDLDSAEQQLSVLEAPDATKNSIKDHIIRAHLKLSRSARLLGSWDLATSSVDRARALANEPSQLAFIESELQLIKSYQSARENGGAEELLIQHEHQVSDHQKQFNKLLTNELSVGLLKEIRSGLDKIDQLIPQHESLADSQARLELRVLNTVDQFESDKDPQKAALLLRSYTDIFGSNPTIQTRLQQLDDQLLEKQNADRISAIEHSIEQILAKVAEEPTWESKLNNQLNQLREARVADTKLNSINTTVALRLSEVADSFVKEKRFDEAEELLSKAEKYDSALGTLQGMKDQLTNAKVEWQQEKELRKQQAKVEGLKQTLLTQLQANDISRAEQSLKALTEILGKDDPYIQSEAHPAFVETYMRLADQLARQTRLTKAAKLLETAKKYSIDTTVLDDKISGYQRDAKLWRIGQTIRSVSLDAFVEAHGMLSEIESDLDEERANKLHNDLIQAVIKRYKQLLGSRPAAAGALIAKAKELYPSEAAIQEIKAPIIPKAQAEDTTKQSQTPEVVKPEITAKAEPVKKEQVSIPKVTAQGKACTAGLAGLGRNVKAVCYDMVSQQVKAPYMVVIPSGKGSPFAISKFEISIEDYNAFCKATGCKTRSGNGRSPITGLSHAQTVSYAKWLTQVTGHRYQLPKYKQWRHAALSGNKRQPNNFNCRLMQGDKVLKGHGLISVRSGEANQWGLVNYLGNAQEWVIKGGKAMAAGGYFADKMSTCSVDLVRDTQASSHTGFRLVRQI